MLIESVLAPRNTLPAADGIDGHDSGSLVFVQANFIVGGLVLSRL
jgi:hypothetical protein